MIGRGRARIAERHGRQRRGGSATSTGIGGGLFRFSDVFSETNVTIDLTVDVQGGTLRGGAVVDRRALVPAHRDLLGRQGRRLPGLRRLQRLYGCRQQRHHQALGRRFSVLHAPTSQVTSFAMTSVNGQAVNRTGGLIAGADTDVDAEIGYAVRTEIGGDIVANRSVLIEASAGYNGVAIASSGSGGLGTNSDANDDSSQGVGIGREHAATVDTVLLGTASLRGAAVQVAAGSGVRWNIDLSDGSIDAHQRDRAGARHLHRRRLRPGRRLRRQRLRERQRQRHRYPLQRLLRRGRRRDHPGTARQPQPHRRCQRQLRLRRRRHGRLRRGQVHAGIPRSTAWTNP